jgi:hypothetical protein
VIEDVRPGVQHPSNCFEITAKIWSQHFNTGIGQRFANFAHGVGKMAGTAVGKIVAVDGGNHYIAQLPARGRTRDVGRFVRIQREFPLVRRAFGHGTESAAAGAEIAEDHESGRAAAEAFVKIGTARRLADRV